MNSFLSPRTVFFGRGEVVVQEAVIMPPPLPADEIEDSPLSEPEGVEPGDEAVDMPADEAYSESIESVVSLAEAGDYEDDDDDEEDIVNDPTPAADAAQSNDMPSPAPATAPKKRGRPSLSASASRNGTPSKTPVRIAIEKTPRSMKSAGPAKATPTAGSSAKRDRKRKADDGDASAAQPAKKARVSRAIRPEREPTRAIPQRGAAVAAKNTFATALKVAKITTVNEGSAPKRAKRRGRKPNKSAPEASGKAWEVEKIIDSGIDADTKTHVYLVKWKNYPDEENTWEPRKNLSGCAALLKAFDTQKKRAKKTPGRKPGRKPASEKPVTESKPAAEPKPVGRKPPAERKTIARKPPAPRKPPTERKTTTRFSRTAAKK